jgi:hypothetical protein
MRIGLCRISSSVAVFMCGCALAGYPQAVPSQGHDGSKGDTRYLRDVVVEKDKTVDTLVCVFCSVVVRGEVKGDVVTVWGNIEIEGKLQGDAVAAGGKIVVRGDGEAEGDLVAVGGRVERNGRKVIKADVSEVPFIYFPGQRSLVFPGTLIFLGAEVVFSMLYIAAGRSRVEALAETVRKRAVTVFLVGVLGMSALVSLFVWASDLGKFEDEVMLAVSTMMLLLVLPGVAGMSLAAGRRLRRGAGAAMAMLIGSLALTLPALLPLVGVAQFMIVWTFALGVTLVGRFGFARAKAAHELPVSNS